MSLDPALAAFATDSRSPLTRALGEQGTVVKILEGLGGRLDGVPLAVRTVSQESRTRALAAAVSWLTGTIRLSEEYLYGFKDGAAELDLEAKVQILALALVEPAPPHDRVVKNADELRSLLDANEVTRLFECYADFIVERSPLSRARSAEEVEDILTGLGKGTIPPFILTSFDSTTLRSIVLSQAIRLERLTSSSSSPTSPSTEPSEIPSSEDF